MSAHATFCAGLYYFLQFEIQARNDEHYATNDEHYNIISITRGKAKSSPLFLAETSLVVKEHSLMDLAMKC